MAVLQADDSNFSEILNGNDKVIVKYFASWCGTCKLLSPKFKRLSNEDRFDSIAFVDINAEESPGARDKVSVDSLPFFATFKNGKIVEKGATSKEEGIVKMLEKIKG